MKVKICPDCGERWWCVKCGYCHWCHPDFEPPAGVAVKPQGGSPTLPSLAVTSYRFIREPRRTQYLEARSMKVLKSGEKVPASGIYRVLHSAPHATEQREMYFEGSRFPECQICAAGVLYRLESPCVPVMTELAMAAC
jgi:hypothetical protein